jgi:3-keto-5-aminohexanoate cleavage enzyme
MTGKIMITAAIVGAETSRKDTPYLPITADEIGVEAAKVREAGAAIVHLHVRDREERCQPLMLKPEMCTLTCGSVNFGDDVFSNPRPLMVNIAGLARKQGVVPEIEVFDAGFMDNAIWLNRKGLLDFPAHFDFVLGVPGGLGADEAALDFLLSRLPGGCTWSVAGIGRYEFPLAELAIKRGGNVRVGLEDNIFIEKGVLAKGNAELVKKAAGLAAREGREAMTPDQARDMLRIPRI